VLLQHSHTGTAVEIKAAEKSSPNAKATLEMPPTLAAR